MAFAEFEAARHSRESAIRFTRGTHIEASLVRFRYGLPGCSPPCTDLTGFPATGGFYFRTSNGTGRTATIGSGRHLFGKKQTCDLGREKKVSQQKIR
jgi:hypothetical protein